MWEVQVGSRLNTQTHRRSEAVKPSHVSPALRKTGEFFRLDGLARVKDPLEGAGDLVSRL